MTINRCNPHRTPLASKKPAGRMPSVFSALVLLWTCLFPISMEAAVETDSAADGLSDSEACRRPAFLSGTVRNVASNPEPARAHTATADDGSTKTRVSPIVHPRSAQPSRWTFGFSSRGDVQAFERWTPWSQPNADSWSASAFPRRTRSVHRQALAPTRLGHLFSVTLQTLKVRLEI